MTAIIVSHRHYVIDPARPGFASLALALALALLGISTIPLAGFILALPLALAGLTLTLIILANEVTTYEIRNQSFVR